MYRVQKILSMIGILSRRECEKLLLQKKIKINNSIAAIGAKVKTGDEILVNGKIYIVGPEIFKSEIKVIAYHKSAGELVTTKDDRNRKTVFANLPNINGKWINIGRLDMNTSGLLLFTNNGDIANALMHPSSKIKRVYEVLIKGNMTNEKIVLSKKGIDIGKGEIGRFLNIVHISNELTNTYKVTLATGKNREIRRVFYSLDCKVVKLKRIKYALAELSNLKVNKYRNLTKDEISNIIKYLKKY
jgi:23S rRNA pseudouridine2605 synthase